jgi:hypothetical protein
VNRLLLVVPGLLWPAQQTHRPAQNMALTALARLLGRGRRRIEAHTHEECFLARLFGVDDEMPPLAALRHLGEDDGPASESDPGAHWLCADPVNLSLTREHLLLADFADDEIDKTEAAALIAALTADFPDLGQFSAATPTRWYLRRERPPTVRFAPLHDAVGRSILHFLPEGEEGDDHDARHWRHILNEVQIALHHHPVNKAREAAGRRAINSLWFWGGSPRPDTTPRAPCPAIQALDPMARGLARAASIEPGLPDVAAALRAESLVVLNELAAPARHRDLDAWRTALAALETDWFAPIAAALDGGGSLHQFQLLAPGERIGFSLTVSHRARWCFWRKPLALDDLHAAGIKSESARQTQ